MLGDRDWVVMVEEWLSCMGFLFEGVLRVLGGGWTWRDVGGVIGGE